MSLSTVKDSGRKLFPYSDVQEGDTGEGNIMQSKQQKKRRLRIGAWNVKQKKISDDRQHYDKWTV